MSAVFHVIRSLIWIYNVISLPVFLVLDFPFTKWLKSRSPRSRQVTDNKWIPVSGTHSQPYEKFRTAAEFLETLGQEHRDRPCLGHRKVLAIESNESGTGMIPKRRLDDKYTWTSYRDVDNRVQNLMRGFASHGIAAGDKVLLALETRAEWITTAMSIIRMGSSLCTVYSTCGIDGIIHVVNETSCTHVVTNQKICKSLLNAVNQVPSLKEVIVVEDQLVPMVLTSQDGIEVVTLAQVEKDGKVASDDCLSIKKKKQNVTGTTLINGNTHVINRNHNGYHNGTSNGKTAKQFSPSSHGHDGYDNDNDLDHGDLIQKHVVKPDDLALIMYTSGTTGVPKGVMFSQRNLIEAFTIVDSLHSSTSGARFKLTQDMSDLRTGCHFAYLPSAHIFEFMLEMFMISLGARIGYGSPFTAFPTSPGLAPGSMGDAETLNPTFTIAVPLVCERIKSSICEEVARKSPLVQKLFHYGIGYKNFWNGSGFSTPITDKVLFKKTRLVFGKQLQTLVVGGAAVAESTHQFLRAALSTTMVQGYGTTETFALATVQNDMAAESDCGHLHSHVEMKLEDWDEGGYRTSDEPNARGELVIGGKHISLGYYKRPVESEESFYQDDSDPGVRWFRTGDIVEVDKKLGTIRIIDRKKDLVKLMNGEFVALGQLESLFKNCSFVSNLMVCANSCHASTIVVAVPDEAAMRRLVDEFGMDRGLLNDLTALCQNETIVGRVTRNIQDIAARSALSKAETPRKVILVPDQWTPDNGLTTATMKIRRKQLLDKYADLIQQAYSSISSS